MCIYQKRSYVFPSRAYVLMCLCASVKKEPKCLRQELMCFCLKELLSKEKTYVLLSIKRVKKCNKSGGVIYL